MIKVSADKLGCGDRLANGDAVVGVELVGNMVELDIITNDGGISIVVPCYEEFEVMA